MVSLHSMVQIIEDDFFVNKDPLVFKRKLCGLSRHLRQFTDAYTTTPSDHRCQEGWLRKSSVLWKVAYLFLPRMDVSEK